MRVGANSLDQVRQFATSRFPPVGRAPNVVLSSRKHCARGMPESVGVEFGGPPLPPPHELKSNNFYMSRACFLGIEGERWFILHNGHVSEEAKALALERTLQHVVWAHDGEERAARGRFITTKTYDPYPLSRKPHSEC